jgi:hypothetical protein
MPVRSGAGVAVRVYPLWGKVSKWCSGGSVCWRAAPVNCLLPPCIPHLPLCAGKRSSVTSGIPSCLSPVLRICPALAPPASLPSWAFSGAILGAPFGYHPRYEGQDDEGENGA